MKAKIISGIFTAGLILIAGLNNINAQFKVDAQYRPRFELRNGYQKLAPQGTPVAAFISQRSRVSFSYESENFKLKFTPQDVRVWGDEGYSSTSGLYGDNASLDLFEGYAEIKLTENSWLSVGRQQLVYDNEWLFGMGNWNQNGNSMDAVVLKIKPFGWNVHLASAWNTMKENSSGNAYPTSRYKSINYLWLNKALKENWNFSLLQVASGLTETDTTNGINFRYTSGFYTDYKNNNLLVTGNAYYQYGRSQIAKPVNAFFFAFDAGYNLGKLKPGVGLSYHSGNKNAGVSLEKDNLFDLIYTSRHKFFGNIDYFRIFSNDTKQGGLADFYFYLDYKISQSISIKNISHYFQLAQTNPNTPTNKKLGYENDLILKYKFSDWGILESGYLFFLPTSSLETMQKVPDSEFSYFFYMQLTLTPNLFKQKPAQ